jgi:serine/threonine-protein phosphatase 5
MFINRGNHEAKEMNRTYGFEGEAKHKHGEQTYKVSCLPFVSLRPLIGFHVAVCTRLHCEQVFTIVLTSADGLPYRYTVPLATLISPTLPPTSSNGDILSPEGKKRYFVVHGGLFSKDDVTLEDIRKINRIGQQPGQEGLMCMHLLLIS